MKPLWDLLHSILVDFMMSKQANKTYPEDLESRINNATVEQEPINVAIIDDKPFPWCDALKERTKGSVDYFEDAHKTVAPRRSSKPTTTTKPKYKPIDLRKYDVVVCDILGVGEKVYEDGQGLDVMNQLRQDRPFSVIVAYTGSPNLIHKRAKDDMVDFIFDREWSQSDFLDNFDRITKIFSCPNARWKFIKKRLEWIQVSEQEINAFRKIYVKNFLVAEYFKKKNKLREKQVRHDAEVRIQRKNLEALLKLGQETSKKISGLDKLFSPSLLGES